MATEAPSRDELAAKYLDQLPYTPYPVQEEALLNWFTSDEGLMVCAPTGTGKTVIAEAALFEALHTGRTAYYTTPLIALTEQKFREMQAAAVSWGFSADDVGLVTGNRTVNPQARILVVVAEILLNRLLHPTAFDFSIVSTVVMDEFHSFADPERGVVWELSLAMLSPHVRVLLLSATVGNAVEFIVWLNRSLERKVQLVQSTERKVPLTYVWVPDELLNEQLEMMAAGEEAERRIPALVFCFNRDECWSVAEQLKGKSLLSDGQQKKLVDELAKHDWSKGAGPKLKQILQRGVGIHHAGILPKYRRIVEELFQRKLLSVCVCTETLAAGINLPARSVVLTTLVKGPPGKKDLIDPSSAPPDVRPRRPPAVRHARICLRAGPRGRRQDSPLQGADCSDSGKHQGSAADPRPQEARKADAHAEQNRKILGGRPLRENADRPARQALQQGATSLAAVGVPVGDFARRRTAEVRRSQTLDGRAPDRGGTKATLADVDVAVGGRLCPSRTRTAASRGARGRGWQLGPGDRHGKGCSRAARDGIVRIAPGRRSRKRSSGAGPKGERPDRSANHWIGRCR